MARETRQVKKAPAKRILFVEDDPVVVSVYRSRLENEGFAVEVVEDGAAAMEYLNNEKPDLVILDLMLPKINGLDVLKFIRSKPQLSTLPVVVLSNAYLADMVKKAMLAGANKPLFKTQCTPAMLAEVVRSFLPQQPEAVKPARPHEEVEKESIEQARVEFESQIAEEVEKIRRLAINYIKSASQPAGASILKELYQSVHFVTARAALTGFSRLAILTSAFEALLFELVFKPGTVTASVLQTIAQTSDCLKRLVERLSEDSPSAGLQARVLVVDDDAVCNHVMVTALQRANLEAVGVKDPRQALDLLARERFDLILLDIRMPGMDGFDVCKRIRQLAHQKTTPVIFITANADFENRVQSVLSGGNEFIAKPVSPMELALKAITLLLDSKLRGAGAEQKPEPATTPEQSPVGPEASSEQIADKPEEEEEVQEEAVIESSESVRSNNPQPPRFQPVPAPGLGPRMESFSKGAEPKPRETVSIPATHQKSGQPIQQTPREPGYPTSEDYVKAEAEASLPSAGVAEEMVGAMEAPEVAPDNGKGEGVGFNTSGMESGAEGYGIDEKTGLEVAKIPLSEQISVNPREGGSGWIPEDVETFNQTPVSRNPNYMQSIQGGMQPMQPKGMGPVPPQTQPRLDRSVQADGSEAFERVVRGVAEIIFGEENLNDINIRLVRFALERYGIKELMRQLRGPQM